MKVSSKSFLQLNSFITGVSLLFCFLFCDGKRKKKKKKSRNWVSGKSSHH